MGEGSGAQRHWFTILSMRLLITIFHQNEINKNIKSPKGKGEKGETIFQYFFVYGQNITKLAKIYGGRPIRRSMSCRHVCLISIRICNSMVSVSVSGTSHPLDTLGKLLGRVNWFCKWQPFAAKLKLKKYSHQVLKWMLLLLLLPLVLRIPWTLIKRLANI